jgi:hypothetical protein
MIVLGGAVIGEMDMEDMPAQMLTEGLGLVAAYVGMAEIEMDLEAGNPAEDGLIGGDKIKRRLVVFQDKHKSIRGGHLGDGFQSFDVLIHQIMLHARRGGIAGVNIHDLSTQGCEYLGTAFQFIKAGLPNLFDGISIGETRIRVADHKEPVSVEQFSNPFNINGQCRPLNGEVHKIVIRLSDGLYLFIDGGGRIIHDPDVHYKNMVSCDRRSWVR